MGLPTIGQLRKALRYCEETGHLYWRTRRGGKRAGWEHVKENRPTNYWRVSLHDKVMLAHRVILAMHLGRWPEEHVDHLDGDGLNNRLENLREVSHLQNQRNRRLASNNKTGISGVWWDKRTNKYRVNINRSEYLGSYDTLEEAKAVREQAEREHGYHENHGKD